MYLAKNENLKYNAFIVIHVSVPSPLYGAPFPLICLYYILILECCQVLLLEKFYFFRVCRHNLYYVGRLATAHYANAV